MTALLPDFSGLNVLSFESRRAREMASLIETHGGRARVAPALREIPLASNREALEFARGLMAGAFDVTIFLTGVGTRELVQLVEPAYPRAEFAAALARTKVVARGPKPLAVLRDLQVPIWAAAEEPNTWHEVLAAVESRASERPLAGARVAVQEYGVENPELLDALRSRGAIVTRVPVYRWALPEDLTPLRDAILALTRGAVDVAIFTTGVQLVHLRSVAGQMQMEGDVRAAFSRVVIASIGPTTSAELRRYGLAPDVEASHPKIGYLVREVAQRSAELLRTKRGETPQRDEAVP